MTLNPGDRLGSYEIITLLGAGGMGEVYGARDIRLDRQVAVKIITPRLSSQPDAVARFEREARAASALNHPNILHVYDIGTAQVKDDEIRYLVMEFVDGSTLGRKIHRENASRRELMEWLAQIAEGLAKAHEAGIVHRDLKPDNVMISRDGYAKILDFGLAKLLERSVPRSGDLTDFRGADSSSSTILGTLGYMSPEQGLGSPVDARSDVFSFGCILFEALSRTRAFDGDSAVDTLHRLIYSAPAPLPRDVGLPRELERLLTWTL